MSDYLYLPLDDTFDTDDLELEIKRMMRKFMQASAEAYGYMEAVNKLKHEFVKIVFKNNGIEFGGICEIHYSDKIAIAAPIGLEGSNIVIKHPLKSGKLGETRYILDYRLAILFKKKSK